jgi:N-acetylmuramoyl-L-alanine amidase
MKIKKKITSIALMLAIIFPASSTLAYTAQSGDSMWSIAVNHHLTLDELKTMNPQIQNPDDIQIGQNINTDTDKNEAKKDITEKPKSISKSDRELLAQLVHAEAKGEPFEGKVKVAKVVLNRVASSKFPNTIKEVILQPHQFTPVETGAIHNTPTADDYKAVDKALSSNGDKDGSLYFYNPDIAKSTWLNSKPTTVVIGHHVFKK